MVKELALKATVSWFAHRREHDGRDMGKREDEDYRDSISIGFISGEMSRIR